MKRRVLVRWWALTGLLLLVLLAVLGRPFWVAWLCYRAAAGGEWTQAEIVAKHEQVGLVLQVTSGSRSGESCAVQVGDAFREEARTGEVLDVVLRADRPGECVLASTVEASGALLWAMTGLAASVVLGILLLALFVHRSYSAAPPPTTRLELASHGLVCPRCGMPMAEGYLPLLAGLHWRPRGEPVGLPHALAGLPGTVGWRGRPRLHAFRCEPCQVITLRYGRQTGLSQATPEPITPRS